MRTKTILLSAACGLLGSLAANAGSVYSVNVVGYVNKSFTAKKFAMIANPLNTENTLSNLFSSLTDEDAGCKVFIWDASAAVPGFKYASFGGYGEGGGWTDANDNDVNSTVLAPGQGFWFYSKRDVTVTFVGDVLTGSLSKTIYSGWNQVGSLVPQVADVAALGLTNPNYADKIFKYTSAGGWDYYSYGGVEDPYWYNVADDVVTPTIEVGEAVWYRASAGFNWSRTFNISE